MGRARIVENSTIWAAAAALICSVIACSSPADDPAADGGADAVVESARCGPGTTRIDSQCVPTGNCQPGTVQLGDNCQGPGLLVTGEPFAAGVTYTLGAPLSESSNPRDRRGRQRFGMRLSADAGSAIAALLPGRVRRADSLGQTTTIVIDHGDETFAHYVTGDSLTVSVAIGDPVCAGQSLATADEPVELAVDVRDLMGFSRQVRFTGGNGERGGLAQGAPTVSDQQPSECDAPAFSICSERSFLHRGVVLTDRVPCSVAPASGPVRVRGNVLGTYPAGYQVAYIDPQTGGLACTPITGGSFEVTLDISGVVGTDLSWYWQVADDSCTALDWGETPAEFPTITLVPTDTPLDAPVPVHPRCGVGTAENADGRCEVRECPDGVFAGGECVPAAGRVFAYPFAAGTTTPIFGGYHANLSHKGEFTYSVDFAVPVGTPVVAIADGTVVGSLDNTVGNGGEGNWLYIDHGGGLTAHYGHLAFQTQRVSIGDPVCRGQVIADSGNTGFSTAPHLHVEVHDSGQISTMSTLIMFAEADNDYGLLMPGRTYTSTTAPPTCQ